jgi:hypothetical protein
MNGKMSVAFTLDKKVPPGNYRVVGYWGGNRGVERTFVITR